MNRFDQWRKDYDTMNLQQQIEFHNEIAKEYPEQAHYDYEAVAEVLDLFRPSKILEYGWQDVVRLMEVQGFKVFKVHPRGITFESYK